MVHLIYKIFFDKIYYLKNIKRNWKFSNAWN